MINLPKWALTSGRPASYDSESATAIEMVAKLYGAMQQLIDEYNKTIKDLNAEITCFEKDTNETNECFKHKIIEIMNDYIETMNMNQERIQKEIDDAIEFMKGDLNQSIGEVVEQMKAAGEIDEAILNSLGNYENELTSVSDRVEELEGMKHLTITYTEDTETIKIV